MLSLSLPVEIYLCVAPTDMRKSFDGLLALAVEHLRRDPLSGGLFVFVKRVTSCATSLYRLPPNAVPSNEESRPLRFSKTIF